MGTAIPCVAQEDIKAGLAVRLVPASGKSIPDVVIGARLPSGDDDAEAHFVANWAVTNIKPPIYQGLPTLDVGDGSVPYTFREFVEGKENLPEEVTLRMVPPRFKDEETIPSGTLMLAYGDGIYTLTSGCYVAGSYEVGDKIGNMSTGKWYESAASRVATVLEYNSTSKKLTIKTHTR